MKKIISLFLVLIIFLCCVGKAGAEDKKTAEVIDEKLSIKYDLSKYEPIGKYLSYSVSTGKWENMTEEQFLKEIPNKDDKTLCMGVYRGGGSGGYGSGYENVRMWIDVAKKGKLDEEEKRWEFVSRFKKDDFSAIHELNVLYDREIGIDWGDLVPFDYNHYESCWGAPQDPGNTFIYDGKIFDPDYYVWNYTADELQQMLPELQIIRLSSMDENKVIKAKAKIPFIIVNDNDTDCYKWRLLDEDHLPGAEELGSIHYIEKPRRVLFSKFGDEAIPGEKIYIDFE